MLAKANCTCDRTTSVILISSRSNRTAYAKRSRMRMTVRVRNGPDLLRRRDGDARTTRVALPWADLSGPFRAEATPTKTTHDSSRGTESYRQ
jgi:hypothetical protein